jgi:hypothetical protein
MANGEIAFGIEDLDVDVVITPEINEDGFIHPVFHDTRVDLGGTYFRFDNWFLEFLAW